MNKLLRFFLLLLGLVATASAGGLRGSEVAIDAPEIENAEGRQLHGYKYNNRRHGGYGAYRRYNYNDYYYNNNYNYNGYYNNNYNNNCWYYNCNRKYYNNWSF